MSGQHLPRDARLIALLLASSPAIADAHPAVLQQLLEFAHRETPWWCHNMHITLTRFVRPVQGIPPKFSEMRWSMPIMLVAEDLSKWTMLPSQCNPVSVGNLVDEFRKRCANSDGSYRRALASDAPRFL